MFENLVLGTSILLQISAAIFALRLIKVTGRRSAWTLIAIGVMLMAIRRSITLFRLLEVDTSQPVDMAAESVALGISVLMVVGISRIAPIFHGVGANLEKVRQGKAKLLQAQYISKMGDFTWDLLSDSIYWSDGMYKLLKYDPEEQIDQSKLRQEILHPDDLYRVTTWLEDCISSGVRVLPANEYRLICKDGAVIHVHTEGGVEYENGTAVRVFGTCQDITDRKRAELALQESNQRYKLLADATFEGIAVTRGGRIVDVNQQILDIHGYTRDEFMKLAIEELIHPEDREIVISRIKGNDLTPYEYRGIARDGSVIHLEVRPNNARVNDEVYRLTILRDITEQKQTEAALRTTERQLSNAMKIARLGYWEYDIQRDQFAFNDQFYAILRTTAEKVGGYTVSSKRYAELFLHPEDVSVIANEIQKAVETDDPNFSSQLEHRIIYADGEVGYFAVRFFIIKDEQGRTIKSYGANQDITERKAGEEALRESEEKYRSLVEAAHDPIFMCDTRGRYMFVNAASAAVLGERPGNIIGKTPADFFPDPVAKRYLESIHKVIESGKGMVQESVSELRGNPYWFSTNIQPIRDRFGNVKAIQAVVRDISSLKRVEDALRESEDRLRRAELLASMGHYAFDAGGNNLVCSDGLKQIFGFAPDVNPTPAELLSGIHPDDRSRVVGEVGRAAAEMRGFNLEYRILCPHSSEATVHSISEITPNEQGGQPRFFGTLRDITERKQAEKERERLERQIRQSQKLETIGTLAGGIAHDFNNILTPIMGYTDMALSGLTDDDPLRSDLKEIFKGATRAKALVSQILMFSRQIEQERVPLDLGQVVEDALKLLRPSIPATIEIRKTIDPSCNQILADPSQMHQVVLNLCTNAFQAMEKTGGVLTLELLQTMIDRRTGNYHPDLKPGEYICLTTADTGPGMDPMTCERIFEPFFTTRPVGKGTGLGLSVVHGIIRGHHGDISVQSEAGKGAKFQMYLPVLESKKMARPEEAEATGGGNESILVIDDEPAVATVVQRMLEQLGYSVDTINDSVEALNVIKGKAEHYDVVITDLTMPGLTGLDLAEELSVVEPKLSVILMTGYGDAVSDEKRDGLNIVGKPIMVKELLDVIQKTIKDRRKREVSSANIGH